jgi:hypothetical protein
MYYIQRFYITILWENIFNAHFKYTGCEDVERIYLVQKREKERDFLNTVINPQFL